MYKILFSSDKNIVNKTIILFAIYQTIPIFAARITKKEMRTFIVNTYWWWRRLQLKRS